MTLRGQTADDQAMVRVIRCMVTVISNHHVAFLADWVRSVSSPITAEVSGTLDLSQRMGLGVIQTTVDTRMILYGRGERSRTFLVDKVIGLIELEVDGVHPLPRHFRGREREWFCGLVKESKQVACVVNPYWMLDLPAQSLDLGEFMVRRECRRKAADGLLQPRVEVDSNTTMVSALGVPGR